MNPKKRVLVVDDEKDLCEILQFRLESFGYEVLLATHADQGFEAVLQKSPDCVLLDIKLSKGEDGLTLLRKLRAYRHDDTDQETRIRKTPVIMLTASGDTMRPLFQLEGAEDYIQKPFDPEDLKRRIEQVLRRS